MTDNVYRPKKLIEVALPLDAINFAAAKEKSIRHGHPSTLHLWWARRPLAAARAVIFSQMVDDPSEYTDVLLRDPKLKRQAETKVKALHKVWKEATATHERARRGGIESQVPAPGREPVLEDVIAQIERERLFDIIGKLVKDPTTGEQRVQGLVAWESTTDETVLQQARDEIWQSWRRTCAKNAGHPRAKELFDRTRLPAFHDPFAGGGALPLEAQRLGLESHASDLNPVAVLINKAMIEIPPRFAGRPPVNPESRKKLDHTREWKGAQGLAEDVRYYGQWMRDEAEKQIGHLYPKIAVSKEMVQGRPDLTPYVGRDLTVIAWLWTRTVRSPNPAFRDVHVPLASSFMLCTKPGKEAWVEPVIERDRYRFVVRSGQPRDRARSENGTSAGKRSGFSCIMSGTPLPYDYIRSEGMAGRLSMRLMAIVVEVDGRRVYLSPETTHEELATNTLATWKPDTPLEGKCRVNVANYGFDVYGDLFTDRQLVALTTLSDTVVRARSAIVADAITAGMGERSKGVAGGGHEAAEYADAVAIYLAFCVDKASLTNTTQASWQKDPDRLTQAFARQALPMVWDFAEANPFSDAGGGFGITAHAVGKVLERLPIDPAAGEACQQDAMTSGHSMDRVVSTDPPYYDNIEYADLSDYFYVWLRRSLKSLFPALFATVAVPKAEELVATPYRHATNTQAETFFLRGMTEAMGRIAPHSHAAFPVTIYYAFKQSESNVKEGVSNTGWDTFLQAVITAGFAISGTWPMRTELTGNLKKAMSALASSIILVCRVRPDGALAATRRDFVEALKASMPDALAKLQSGNVAPVDLAQAAIGPGMAVYTSFSRVIDAEGKPVTVRQALAIINEVLDETLAHQEGDFDPESRWAVTWLDSHGFSAGPSGEAILLSTARGTALNAIEQAGFVEVKGGKTRLLKPSQLDEKWDPNTDTRLTAWETVHHLIRILEADGESGAAAVVAQLGVRADLARELAYRLYMISDRKKRAAEALSYNALVQSWPEILRLATEAAKQQPVQTGFGY